VVRIRVQYWTVAFNHKTSCVKKFENVNISTLLFIIQWMEGSFEDGERKVMKSPSNCGIAGSLIHDTWINAID
jgi:hypothetical protein